jgi:hypothetical protein
MTENKSIISPLRIDAVTVPGTGGLIGMTICPGKDEYAGLGIPSGPWKRDLDLDLLVIREWGAHRCSPTGSMIIKSGKPTIGFDCWLLRKS